MREPNDTCDREPGWPADGLALTRRGLCSLGLGVSAGAALGLIGSPAFAAQRQGIRYVITDQRYAQSLEFGAALVDQGARRLETTNGLTRLWSEALVPLWRGDGGTVAGLTLDATWACLAEQARSCGRRSVMVGRHLCAGDEGLAAHALSVPRQVLGYAGAVERCGSAWPRAVADLAVRCPADARRPPDSFYRSSRPVASPSPLALTSWIIA